MYMLAYLTVAALSQTTIAMGPLLCMFLARDRYGDFSQGPLFAGLFAVGCLVGASTLGVFGKLGGARRRLVIGLLGSGFACWGIAAAVASSVWLLYPLVFAIGLAPAAAVGFVQAGYLSLFSDDQVARGFVLWRIQGVAAFVVGPTLVGALALTGSVWGPMVAGCFSIAAGVLVPTLKRTCLEPESGASETPSGDETQHKVRLVRIFMAGWPIFMLGMAATFGLGLVELVLPPLFVQRGYAAEWAGSAAGAFFFAGLAGTALHSLRKKWPMGYVAQYLCVTATVVCGIVGLAFMTALPGLIAALLVTGAGVAVLLTIRVLALREALPPHLHAGALSLNYSASAVGYLSCTAVASTTSVDARPTATLLVGAATIVAITAVAALCERQVEKPAHAVAPNEQQQAPV